MIPTLILLLLIASASDNKKVNGAQILKVFRHLVQARMLIFQFLEFADLYYFTLTNSTILAKFQLFFENEGFAEEMKIFFDRENSFGLHYREPVHPYRLLLFLKMKVVPKEKVSLKIALNGPNIETFEENGDSILIKTGKPFYNIEKPRDIPVAFSFEIGERRFVLDKVSLPTPFFNGKRTASWREMKFEVYFKYVSPGYVADVTYPCTKGVLPFVIDDGNVMFWSPDLNIFQNRKLISNIPNIKKVLLLEEILQNQRRQKTDISKIKMRTEICIIL